MGDLDPGVAGKADFRADTDSHADEIGRQAGIVFQKHAFHMVGPEDGSRRSLGEDLDTALLKVTLQKVAGSLIELTLHQVPHQVQHGHVHAAHGKARGCFQTQQATADHHGLATLFGSRDHGVGVVQVAVSHNAGQILAIHRNDEGGRAGGDDELVIRHRAVCAGNGFGFAINLDHRFAETGDDAIGRIEIAIMGDDFLVGLLAGQDRRQHEAIVVSACLGVEQRDLEGLRIKFDQMFDQAAGCHTGTDDDEFFPCHDG